MKRILLMAVLAAGLAVPALAQDNIEGPYGAVNGDLFARARLDKVVGQWAAGMDLAWVKDVRAAGYDRVGLRTHPVFDANGDIYWLTSIATPDQRQYVAKARASDGTLLWKSQAWLNGAPGQFGTGGVVVGQQAVYAFCGGVAYDYDGDTVPGWAAAAFNKATGATIWLIDLDGDWDNNGIREQVVDVNGEYHPTLYNGRVYIAFHGSMGLGVVILDAATGAFLSYNIVVPGFANTAAQAGVLTFVPNIFPRQGGGFDHGLFLCSGMWSPPHDVWGIRITSTGAQLEWQAPHGKQAGRSHLIYNPTYKHLYACTWWDDDWNNAGQGQGFGVYDAVTGMVLGSKRGGNHGYYDTASLGWDDSSVVAGEFNGRVNVYPVAPNGTVGNVKFYTGNPDWRELMVFQQLLRYEPGDMYGVVLSGTYDGSGQNPPYPAKIVMLDMKEATEPLVVDDGPAYIDDVEILDGPDFQNLILRHQENFDGNSGFIWQVGNATTQNPNWVDGGTFGVAVPEIVQDPTGSNHGLVLKLDPLNEGEWPAILFLFDEVGLGNGQNVAVIRWKQYRVDLLDDLWINPGDLPWGWQDDQDGYLYPIGPGGNNPRAKLAAGVWETVELWIDQVNQTYEAYVNGLKDPRPPASIHALSRIDAMYWDLTSTPWIAPYVPPMAYYDLPFGNHARSPVMGPDGKVYYFQSGDGKLVALKPAGPTICRGDLNCDAKIDFGDINPFVLRLSNPAGYQQQYPNCPNENGDINANGVVGFDDINPFVSLLSSGQLPIPCP